MKKPSSTDVISSRYYETPCTLPYPKTFMELEHMEMKIYTTEIRILLCRTNTQRQTDCTHEHIHTTDRKLGLLDSQVSESS